MKTFRILAACGGFAVLSVLTTGCGGVSGSHSVSPASFFLPGLIHHTPAVPASPDAPVDGGVPAGPEAQAGQLPS